MAPFRGDWLRQRRLAAGQTRQQLAARAGIGSTDRIRDWERGVHNPQPQYVPRLAAALGIEALSLFDVDPARPPLMAIRLARGFSLQRLSEAAGVPLMTCQRIEQGRGRPAGAVLARLAGALGADLRQLNASANIGDT